MKQTCKLQLLSLPVVMCVVKWWKGVFAGVLETSPRLMQHSAVQASLYSLSASCSRQKQQSVYELTRIHENDKDNTEENKKSEYRTILRIGSSSNKTK